MNHTLRYIQAIAVIYIAIFFTFVAIDNIVDPDLNWQVVKHVTSMDTTFKSSSLSWRAITNENIQRAFFIIIILWELLTAFMCWVAGILLFINNKKPEVEFSITKNLALCGLFIGLSLYMFGFIIIGGEWFGMWQSKEWNAQPTAALFSGLIMFVMLFLR